MLLAVDSTVFVVDADDAADQGVDAHGPLLRLAPAPGGKFLAGLTAAGRLVVWLSDFTKVGLWLVVIIAWSEPGDLAMSRLKL